MLILQDFEAITPNLLARTIETVEGGGIVVCLLQGMKSLRDLYGMTMVTLSKTFALEVEWRWELTLRVLLLPGRSLAIPIFGRG